MPKDLTQALKKISSIVQASAPCVDMAADVCACVADFTGAFVLLADNRGKQLMRSTDAFRLRESVDGFYLDSKFSDWLRDVAATTCVEIPDEKLAGLLTDAGLSCRCGLVMPLYGGERLATLILCREAPFDDRDTAFIEASCAVVTLALWIACSAEASDKRRDSESVKLAIGNLSYSELAAVLQIFRDIGGEGITVATRIADNLGIARSLVVTALRKLEGAGIIETRSLGMKGTYIKVLNGALLEELYKMR